MKFSITNFGIYPNDSDWGKDLLVLPDEDHVKICSNWLSEFALPCGRWIDDRTSYGLKHTTERWAGEYVTNGAFIEAADRRGIAWRPSFKGSPNAIFKMKIGEISTNGAGPAVYLVQCDAYYKIGISDNVQRRLKQLDAASPFELKLVHVIHSPLARELESQLHKQYASKRKKGEWFSLNQEDVDRIIIGDW